MFRHSSLFQFKNGDHTCVFYRTQQALMEVLTPYIADGLRRSERCFCAQKPQILKRLVYDLWFLGIDPDQEIRRGALELQTVNETYLPNDRFEPRALMDMLIRSIEEARRNGFRSFRTAGELSWAVEGRNVCDHVVGYEKLVDEYYPGQPAIGLCQYSMSKFEPHVLQAVLQAHRMQVVETATHSDHASMHIRDNSWSAEIVADKMALSPRYYYVVHHREPSEPLGWGIAPDFDSASANIDRLTCSSQVPS
jgi:MEDS: MEthanogen/methylotroph, DcmR Sensory domain